MTLKLVLKPGEPLFIGGAEIRIMSAGNCTVLVEGDAPILRAQYAVDDDEGDAAATRLQRILQRMYLGNDVVAHRDAYMAAVTDLLAAHPEHAAVVKQTNKWLAAGDIYKAVRTAHKLSETASRSH